MIIVAGGCSFVWGSELSDSPHGGPDGYSKKTFTALLAGDDEYICVAYPGQNNIEIAEKVMFRVGGKMVDAVIVCWTWPSRNNKTDSDEEILLLQDFLEDRGIPYLFTAADNCIKTDNENIKWENWFWFPAGESPGQTLSPRGFYQWAVENKYPVGEQKHPLEQAHQDAAKLLQGKFNELVEKLYPTNKDGNTVSEKAQRNAEKGPVHLQMIYTIGDSFTYGEELSDRSKSWPHLLASRLNADVVNDGKRAGSNDYMIRKLIDHIVTNKNQPPDLVIIGWSSPGRFEWADDAGTFDIWPGYRGRQFDADGSTWRHELSKYIDRFHSSKWLHQRFVNQVLMTQSFLKSMGIKYIMLNVLQNEYYKRLSFDNYLAYEEKIDRDYFIGYGTEGMLEWADDAPKGPDGHFLEKGHQIVARKIYEHIRHLGWVS